MRRLLLASVVSLALLLVLANHPGGQPRAAQAEFPAADLSTSLLFECLPDNTIRVHFVWAASGQGPQWVDLSLFDNDFALGTFLTSGPLPPGQSTLAWDGLVANTQHFVRVNTLTPGGWFASKLMIFSTPNDCPFAILAPMPATGAVNCPNLNVAIVSGCVWTTKPDFATYAVGEIVTYCFFVSQPADVKIIATKPDGSSILVVDGLVSLPGACVGPYQANVPLGLRTVRMYGGPDFQLLSETHFFVQ